MADLKKKIEIVIGAKDQSAKSSRTARESLERLGRAATIAGTAVAAATTASAILIGRQVKETVDFADSIAKVSSKIGVAVEDLSALGYAAQLTGVEQRTLNMALQRFSRRVAEAAKGKGELKNEIASLGIQLRDSNGNMRKSIDILHDYADAIQNAESDQEKLRLAFKAFDSEGAALVNLLRNGSDGLRKMTNEAAVLGIVIETETAKRAERFNDQLTRIKSAGKGFSILLVSELLPILEKLANAVIFQVKRFNEWRDSVDGLQTEMQSFLQNLNTGFLTVYGTMHQFWDGLRLLWEMFKSVGIVIGQTSAIINNVLVRKVEAAIDIFRVWRDHTVDLINSLKVLGSAILDIGKAMIYMASGNIMGIKSMGKTFVELGKEFESISKKFQKSFIKSSAIVADTLKQDMEVATSGIKAMFGDLQQQWSSFTQSVNAPQDISWISGPEQNLFPGRNAADDIDIGDSTLGTSVITDELAELNNKLAETKATTQSLGQTMSQSFGNAASAISNAALMAQDMSAAAKQAGAQIVQTFIDLAIRRVIDGTIATAQAARGVAAMVGVTKANTASAAATAAAWAPAAAAVSSATFGANSIPANAGLLSTFSLAQTLSALGKISSVVVGQAHDGVVFPRSGSYLMNVQKGEQIIPRTPGPTAQASNSGPLEINIQLGSRTLARGVVDVVRNGMLNLKISNNQRVVAA